MSAPGMVPCQGMGCQGLQVPTTTSAVGAVTIRPHLLLDSSLCPAPAGINRGKHTLTTKGGLVPLLCAPAPARSTWASPWVTPSCYCLTVPMGWAGALMLILHSGFMQPAAAWGAGVGGRHRVTPSPFRGCHNWAAQPQGAGSARACLLCAAAALHVPPSRRTLRPTRRWGSPLQRPPPHACQWTLLGPKRARAGAVLLSGRPGALRRSPC